MPTPRLTSASPATNAGSSFFMALDVVAYQQIRSCLTSIYQNCLMIPPSEVLCITRTSSSTCITCAFKNLPPTVTKFLEDQISIGVEATVHRKDFADTVTVKIQLVDKVDAGKKAFRRRFIRLELYEVGAHCGALRLGNQKEIALEFVFGRRSKAADEFELAVAVQICRGQVCDPNR